MKSEVGLQSLIAELSAVMKHHPYLDFAMKFSKFLQIYWFNYCMSHEAVGPECSTQKQIRKVSLQEKWDEQKHSSTLIIQFPLALAGIK